jgi:hypothetical protein
VITVQFDSIIVDGRLEIPKQFRGKLDGKVHVVVTQAEEEKTENGLRALLRNPLHIPDFVPLTRDEANER